VAASAQHIRRQRTLLTEAWRFIPMTARRASLFINHTGAAFNRWPHPKAHSQYPGRFPYRRSGFLLAFLSLNPQDFISSEWE
jgi:hypothetical protein